MPTRSKLRCVCLLLFLTKAAHGQQADVTEADRQFRAGTEAFQNGSADAALRHFESAYQISPHHSVLYNLGLTYSMVGRSVEAVDALSRYLELGKSEIPTARRDQVNAIIALNQRRIGELDLSVHPDGAKTIIDGKPIEAGGLKKPLRLSTGVHGIAVQAAGFGTEVRSATVVAGTRQTLRIALVPASSASSLSEAGVISVSCAVPDARVQVDGGPLLDPERSSALVVPAGRHRVRFSRNGYEPDEQEVAVGAGMSQRAACSLSVARDLPADKAARLAVSCPRAGARVAVDAVEYHGEPLPAGRHHVTVHCAGCVPWSADVDLAVATTRWLQAAPALLPETTLRLAEERARRRTWMWITGGAGLVFGATSAALFANHAQRMSEWTSEGERLDQRLYSGGTLNQNALSDAFQHQNAIASIQKTQDFAIGFAVAGAAALAISGVIFFGESFSGTGEVVRPRANVP